MNPEWKTAVDEFRETATRFITVVDSCDEYTSKQFLEAIEGCLLELYSSAIRLPQTEPGADDTAELPSSLDEWAIVLRKVEKKLGEWDHYWTVFDSMQDEKPVDGMISGDVADIYRDLKESLVLLNQNPPDLWEVRFLFTSHWGRHLSSALKAIFGLRSVLILG